MCRPSSSVRSTPQASSDHDGSGCELGLRKLSCQGEASIDVNSSVVESERLVQEHASSAIATTAASPPPPPPRNDKVLFLDGLRGLAALMVVVQHSGFVDASLGEVAVDTFFVLSAFLLTTVFERKARRLLETKAPPRQWGYALLDYFARRLLRVYPLFALVAIYLALQSPQQQHDLFFVEENDHYSLLRVLTFQEGSRYFVFWTLPLEIEYYFIIPVLVVGVLKLGRYAWVFLVPATVFVTYAGLTWFRWYQQTFGPQYPTFLTGSIAAFAYTRLDAWIKRSGFVFKWYHKLAVQAFEVLLVVIVFSIVFNGLAFHWFIANPVPHSDGVRFTHGNVALIIVCELLVPGVVTPVLTSPPLRFAGKISFSMYLTHAFVVRSSWVWAQKSAHDQFFSIWILVFLLATASYYVVEAPCLKLAGRISEAIKRRSEAHARAALPTHSPTPEPHCATAA